MYVCTFQSGLFKTEGNLESCTLYSIYYSMYTRIYSSMRDTHNTLIRMTKGKKGLAFFKGVLL